FVKKLLSSYEEALASRGLVDKSGLVPYAKEARPTGELVVVDPYALRSAVDTSLLQALTAGDYIVLSQGKGFVEESNSSFPVQATEFFHALGPIAEAREVMRRIAERRLPWDQVEIIASSDDGEGAAAI